MIEAGSQDELQIRLLQAMNTMIEQQHETMLKMFEERDASYRRHEATAENVIGGSGGNVVIPVTDETPVTEVRRGGRSCAYKDFMCTKPPEFSGADDPVLCMKWLREIEQSFGSCECEERQKVKFASQMLRGDALVWWNVTTVSLGPAIVSMLTWEMFKAKLMEEYCNERALDRIVDEFRALKKGDKSVREYSRLFVEKMTMVPHVVPNEAERIKAYVKGLPAEMMEMVRSARPSTLRGAIEEAQYKEDAHKLGMEERKMVGEKRKWEGNPVPPKRPSYNNNNNRRNDARREPSWCSNCRSKHLGPCNPTSNGCFKCGKAGHISRDCPIKGPLCFECRESGHVRRDCPKLRMGESQKKIASP